MPQLPDMSGQPPWVVLVVMVLFIAGWVGTRWVDRGRHRDRELDEDDDSARPLPGEGVPSGLAVPAEHHATGVIMRALELLHQEAEESREGREEAARWRDEALQLRELLETCESELDARRRPQPGAEGMSG